MPSQETHLQKALPVLACEHTLEAARAYEWHQKFEGIDAFVAHAVKSARLEPVQYALHKTH